MTTTLRNIIKPPRLLLMLLPMMASAEAIPASCRESVDIAE